MTRSTVYRLITSATVSVAVWLFAQDTIGVAVKGVVAAVAALAGERVYPLDGDRVALVVGPTPGQQGHSRLYGSPLLRWHVNSIAAPIFAAVLGTMPLRRRALVAAAATALTIVFDGVCVFLYLWLGARGMRESPVWSPTFDAQLAYAIAVFGSKLIPVIAWAIAHGGLLAASRLLKPSRVAA